MKTFYVIAVFVALPMFASDDAYKFHVSITSEYEALGVINPRFQQNYAGTSRQAALEKKKVLLFSKGEMGHWKTMMDGCPNLAAADCEWMINSSGGGGRKPKSDDATGKFDLSFSVKTDGNLTVRCLRPSCQLHFDKGETKGDFALVTGESADVPIDSDIFVTLAPRQ